MKDAHGDARQTATRRAPRTCTGTTRSMACKTTATDRLGRRPLVWAIAFASATGVHSRAWADPLRLRADALADTGADTRDGASPAGLVVLQAEDSMRPWVSAEGLVWTGAGPGAGSGAPSL